MNNSAAHPALRFSPAAAGRISATATGRSDSTLAKLRALWQEHRERVHCARAQAAFAEIDAHTLKDIGAPDWILAEASQRAGNRDVRMLDLYRS